MAKEIKNVNTVICKLGMSSIRATNHGLEVAKEK